MVSTPAQTTSFFLWACVIIYGDMWKMLYIRKH